MDEKLMNQQLGQAIQMAAELQQTNPQDGTLTVVAKQLTFLQESYDRDQTFQLVPKERMTFGVIAAKNGYDVNYPKFADLLHQISYAIKHQS